LRTLAVVFSHLLVASSVASSVAVSIVACGGSTQDSSGGGNNAQPDGGGAPPDTGTGNGDAGVQADAAPDAPAVDPGNDVYPAPHPPLPLLRNFGGPVLGNMKIITVTYVGNTGRDSIRAFDDMIVKSPWWTSVTDGFAIQPGTSGGYAELVDDVSGKTLDNDTDLKPMIQKLVTAGKLPPPDANTLYAFYFPASTTITLQGSASCQAFGAYHDSGPVTFGGATTEAAFAIMPDCGGGTTDSASHEFIEAATDPHPQTTGTWYAYNDAWFGAGGGEVADLCQARGSATEGGQSVARSWTNSAAAASHDPCQPADPKLVYFGAAIATDTIKNIPDPTGSPPYDSEGYLVVKKGATRVVDVVVFSEKKLPHDLSIVAGKRKKNSANPSDVTAIATGVTSTLSQATGKNGARIALTLAVDAATVAGDYPFVVRAILETGDYHSWPAILRVE
jgi:hypothetical protein